MKNSHKIMASLVLVFLFGLLPLGGSANAEGEVSLFTAYTSLSVPPGEKVNYSIDVINNSSAIQNALLSVDGMPDGWEYSLTAGGKTIQQISVKPEDSQSVNLSVDVPLKVSKGNYTFHVTAKGMASLPLTISVAEEGTYKSELSTKMPNMEGHADSTFNYSVTVTNHTADTQLYALKADLEAGWDANFTVDAKSVTSVSVDANATKDVSIAITPPGTVKAGTYSIPIHATTSTTSASTELQAAVTGTVGLSLSTPSGLLSTNITAGHEKTITLQVTNTGTIDLRGITLNSAPPADWDVSYVPYKVDKLAAGESVEVKATIKAGSKAIAGDYVVTMSAQSPDQSANAQFRVAVKTSVLWGWLGVAIVLFVVGMMYYLFRTYGRR